MHRFIRNIFIVSFLIVALHIILAQFADGSTDNFYLRFTSPEKSSLIIGTSRSAQGIHPDILDSILETQEINSMYNYSFSVNNSSYGEQYYNAIKNKINKDSDNGLFIVTVDPWSISLDTTLNENEIDVESLLYSMRYYNSAPNYEYLIKKYKKGWGNILFKRIESVFYDKIGDIGGINGSYTYLRNDGLLEVYTRMDSAYVSNNIKKKTNSYVKLVAKNKFSEYRFDYLKRTIELLKDYGEVYLVRIPVHESLLSIEDSFYPGFDNRMITLSNNMHIEYLNFSNISDDYSYTDGNHLYIEDAKRFSIFLSESIKKHKIRLR